MGRQIQFRASDGDLRALEDELHQRGTRFLAYYHESHEPTFVSTLDRTSNPAPIIWLVRNQDLPLTRLKHIATQGYWLIDQFASPVVELSRGRDGLSPDDAGRLYFATTHLSEAGGTEPFAPEFVNWAAGILGHVRRTFTRDAATGVYDGPDLLRRSAVRG